MPSAHTSQPRPAAPIVGDCQSSSANLMSCNFMLIPRLSREPR